MPIPFEFGNINISSSGWTYPIEVTTKRLRTIAYETIRLYAGDIIKIVPNKSIRIFLGMRYNDGTFGYRNWQSKDYSITDDGEYVMLVAYNPDEDITDFGELASSVYIRRSYGKYLQDLQLQKAAIISTHNSLNAAKRNTKSINHRGWFTAPENTLIAFMQSKYYGFDCVETDIRATKDGVFVLLHDPTIDRVSDGTGNIADLTYEQVLQYDFGVYKGEQYAGIKICTLTELLDFCKWTSVEPYLELKNTLSENQIHQVVDVVADYGMLKNVTFFGDSTVANIISQYNHDVRVGIVLFSDVTQSAVNSVLSFRERGNTVFINAQIDYLTDDGVTLAKNANIPLEVWNVSKNPLIRGVNPYVSGFTSDNVVSTNYMVWYKRYKFSGMD